MIFYIDPGTGSMLFTILIGVVGAAFYSVKMLWMKMKYTVSGEKADISDEKIPFVIYSDDKRYWNIFRPICREMEKLGKEIVYLTGSDDDPALTCEYKNVKAKCIGKDNKSFAHLNFLNANIVLSTTPGLDVYQWKRSKNVDCYVHIPHAAGDITLYRMFGIDYYDSVLLSGQYQIDDVRALEAMRNLPEKERLTVGIPYMDEMVNRLKNADPLPPHDRTVLLAPSWGQSAILAKYGSEIIETILKTGYNLIIRPHPQSFESEKELMDKLMQAYPDSDRLQWNRDRDNFDVLNRSDILISDFSGVVFDFTLVYDKPVIYTDPKIDVSVYDAWWLKKELWTTKILPELGEELTPDKMGNLKELIDRCIEDPRYEAGRRKAKAECWEHFGQGAELTAKYLVNKYEEIKGKEVADQ